MKRSEINSHIESALAFMESVNFRLPRFFHWTPETMGPYRP